jgi:hypothetical protein
MRLRAYVLAADPAWLETSMQSYYDIVERIVVSYDRNKVGWTGRPLPIDECIERAKAIDKDKKMEFAPGDFAILSNSPMENETRQRREALALAGDADWVFQLDTDEVVTQPASLHRRLAALPASTRCVRWPMRSLFQRAADGRYLEVCSKWGGHVEEYFSIAVRPGTALAEARLAFEETVAFRSWTLSRESLLNPNSRLARSETMLHFSWVRSKEQMTRKLGSWGHSRDFDTDRYYREVWLRASTDWKSLRDFHPMTPPTWPRLRPVALPYAPNW